MVIQKSKLRGHYFYQIDVCELLFYRLLHMSTGFLLRARCRRNAPAGFWPAIVPYEKGNKRFLVESHGII